ncbi:MAG TPA: tyrosine-type recombinase/integrase [Candidatus Udaeobacter sp.]|nr:tyrosine-type recombinase/integrase [Candidatus Udaeobacter sp.]
MKRPQLKVREYSHHKTHRFLLDLRPFGNGRMFFKTRFAAESELRKRRATLEKHGREALALSPHEISDWLQARSKLAEHGETINDAVTFRIDHLERIKRCNVTAAKLADEVVESKRKKGKSEAYIYDLRKRLTRFCRDFGDKPIAGISVEDLDDWLSALSLSPKSVANYRVNIGVLFSYAYKRRMINENPIEFIDPPKLVDAPPEIFAVDQLRALLETAQLMEPSVLPMLAIGAFAGLRDAEIRQLDWNEIDLAHGHIEVKAAKAKSARRRIVPIQPNLLGWLRPYADMSGPVVPDNARKKLLRVREEAGLTSWPKNGLRHSFASYRLAAIHDAPRVSAELGHTNPQMLYGVYREIVRPEEAERYWKIEPVAETANVLAFDSGG